MSRSVRVLLLSCPGRRKESPGSKESSGSSSEDLDACMSDIFALREFFQEDKKAHISSRSHHGADLTVEAAKVKVREFFRRGRSHSDLFVLAYVGHGQKGTGAWKLQDGNLAFDCVLDMWDEERKEGNFLLVFSDSCHSGHLCQRAFLRSSMVFVQASCREEEKATDGLFTPVWISLNRGTMTREEALQKLASHIFRRFHMHPVSYRHKPVRGEALEGLALLMSDQEEVEAYWLALRESLGETIPEALQTIEEESSASSEEFPGNPSWMPRQMHLPSASEELRADRRFMLQAVELNGCDALQFASEALRADRDFILQAVEQNGGALRYADEQLKADRDFALQAVQRKAGALPFVSEELQTDFEFLLDAVQLFSGVLPFCREEIRANSSFMKQAVQRNPDALEFASDVMKKDRDFLLEAVRHAPLALSHAIHAIEANPDDFLLQVVQQSGAAALGNPKLVLRAVERHAGSLQFASERLRTCPHFVLEAIDRNPGALQFAPNVMKADPNFVLQAVRLRCDVLDSVSTEMWADNAFVVRALHDPLTDDCKAHFLRWVQQRPTPPPPFDDRNFMLSMVESCACALRVASQRLRTSRDFVLEAVHRNPGALRFASTAMQDDRDFVLEAVHRNSGALRFASTAMQDDLDFVLEAVHRDPGALRSASTAMQDNRDFVLEVVHRDPCALRFASTAMQDDRDFVLEAVHGNPGALRFASTVMQDDRDFVLEAVHRNPGALRFASTVMKDDRDFVLKAVQRNPGALQFASDVMKTDREFVLQALQRQVLATEYVSEAMWADSEFVLQALERNLGTWSFSVRHALERSLGLRSQTSQTRTILCDAITRNVRREMWADHDFVLGVLRRTPWWDAVLKMASPELKTDRRFILQALEHSDKALRFAHEQLLEDRAFMLEARERILRFHPYSSHAPEAPPAVAASAGTTGARPTEVQRPWSPRGHCRLCTDPEDLPEFDYL